MLFRVELTLEETQRACTAIVAESLPKARGVMTSISLNIAVVVVAAVFARDTFPVTAAIGIGAIFATALASQAVGRAQLRHLTANDSHARESHEIELTADGLRVRCSHVDARYPWNSTTRVAENAEFYLFLRNGGNGVAIPKRLVDAQRAEELHARIREWSPDRGNFLSPIRPSLRPVPADSSGTSR